MDLIKLYSYWRSSAAYRVRIALNLKELKYDYHSVHLTDGGGQQHQTHFHQLNPQELVPVLVDGERVIRQSMAIIEYLEETYPDRGFMLMPPSPRERGRVRAIAQLIACDIHPINNLRVLDYLKEKFFITDAQREAWVQHWIGAGFVALEDLLSKNPVTGEFCDGDVPTMADCCLIPQVYNARRFGVDMKPFPTIVRIYERCMELPKFQTAAPEVQPDAPVAR